MVVMSICSLIELQVTAVTKLERYVEEISTRPLTRERHQMDVHKSWGQPADTMLGEKLRIQRGTARTKGTAIEQSHMVRGKNSRSEDTKSIGF